MSSSSAVSASPFDVRDQYLAVLRVPSTSLLEQDTNPQSRRFWSWMDVCCGFGNTSSRRSISFEQPLWWRYISAAMDLLRSRTSIIRFRHSVASSV